MDSARKGSPGLDLEELLVEQLRGGKVRVPPYPAVAAKLQSVTAGEGYGVREVTPIVAADATLSAAILRQANAASAPRAKPIDSLDAAVFKLGAQEIVRLALAQSMGRAAAAPGPLASLRREQWRASLISAAVCQALAPRRGLRPDLAFMAGLLHDFGSVVVVACLEEIGQTQELPTLSEATWREVIQNFHIDFGMVLASRWKLPEALGEAMASHHDPNACLRPFRPLVQLVATADLIVAALEEVPLEGEPPLATVAGIEDEDRALVAAVLPRLTQTLSSFESCMPPPGGRAEVPSKVRHEPAAGSWPIDVQVLINGDEKPLRAVALAPNAITVRCAAPLRPNWLAKMTLLVAPDAASLLVNVKSCEADEGGWLVVMQPFGLDGASKSAWLGLLASTRRSLGLPGRPAVAAG